MNATRIFLTFCALSTAFISITFAQEPEWATIYEPFADVKPSIPSCVTKRSSYFGDKELLLIEAHQGNVNSMLLLAESLYAERPPDETGAKRWYEEALATKHNIAIHSVAVLHLCGHIYPLNTEAGVELLIRAANNGRSFASRELGNIYELGGFGIPIDHSKAIYWYKKSDSIDYPRALYQGIGGTKSAEEAVRWLKRANVDADKKMIASGSLKYNLALFHLKGEGTPRNEVEAMKLLRQIRDGGAGMSELSRKKAALLLQRKKTSPM